MFYRWFNILQCTYIVYRNRFIYIYIYIYPILKTVNICKNLKKTYKYIYIRIYIDNCFYLKIIFRAKIVES